MADVGYITDSISRNTTFHCVKTCRIYWCRIKMVLVWPLRKPIYFTRVKTMCYINVNCLIGNDRPNLENYNQNYWLNFSKFKNFAEECYKTFDKVIFTYIVNLWILPFMEFWSDWVTISISLKINTSFVKFKFLKYECSYAQVWHLLVLSPGLIGPKWPIIKNVENKVINNILFLLWKR